MEANNNKKVVRVHPRFRWPRHNNHQGDPVDPEKRRKKWNNKKYRNDARMKNESSDSDESFDDEPGVASPVAR